MQSTPVNVGPRPFERAERRFDASEEAAKMILPVKMTDREKTSKKQASEADVEGP